jgi:hypothetical protein
VANVTAEGSIEALPPGTTVEVRNGFDGSWSRGFAVEATGPGGYRLRRLSDGEVLPRAFDGETVRRERGSSNTWWV